MLADSQRLCGHIRRGAGTLDPGRCRSDIGAGFRQGGGRHDSASQRFALLFGLAQPCPQPVLALGEVAALAVERSAARVAGGAGLGHLLQAGFGNRELGAGSLDPRRRLRARRLAQAAGAFQRLPLVGETGERGIAIGEMLAFAVEIGGELRATPFGFGARGDDPAQFCVERFAGVCEALCGRGRFRLRQAQRRQRRLGLAPAALVRKSSRGRGGQRSLARAQFGGKRFGFRRRGAPAGIEEPAPRRAGSARRAGGSALPAAPAF